VLGVEGAAQALAHAAPIDSFSNCSKSRMSIGRESMRSVRENE
jgi:hypothetical protein